jgi:hypothetical protein
MCQYLCKQSCVEHLFVYMQVGNQKPLTQCQHLSSLKQLGRGVNFVEGRNNLIQSQYKRNGFCTEENITTGVEAGKTSGNQPWKGTSLYQHLFQPLRGQLLSALDVHFPLTAPGLFTISNKFEVPVDHVNQQCCC